MNWFYSINGQQIGPVSDSQLDALLGSGEINRDTPVCREGTTDWQPLNVIRASGLPPMSGAAAMVCAECGRTFPSGELIQLNRSWICAQCKPVFLQKMSEGVATAGAGGGLWRMNNQLVTRSETPFPDRCLKCNAPANGFQLKRVLYWHHPAYYLLLLCYLVIYIIVALIVRKKAVLHVGLCAKHRAQRQQAMVIGWVGALGGLALAITGAVTLDSGLAVIAGFLLFIGAAVYGAIRGSVISAAKITGENVWVKGVHPDFLAGLPEWPGA